MAAKPKKPETRLVVLVTTDKGERAAYTIPVREDVQAAADRAEAVRSHVAATTGRAARIDTFTHVA